MLAQYNGELLTRQSALVKKGQEEAGVSRPPSNAMKLDQHEVETQSDAEKWIAITHQALSAAVTESSRATADLQQKLLDLKGRLDQAMADQSLHSTVQAEMSDEKQSLVTAAEERIKAQVDLRSFQAKHSITEPAKYPESRLMHFALIAVLTLGETLVNAVFYANAQGLLGGFGVALGVAIVNIGSAVGLGMLFRYKNVVEKERRLGGWVCFVLFIVSTVFMNALFAAFRAEYQRISDITGAAPAQQLFARAVESAGRIFLFEMPVGDLMSFILFGVGLILSAFAFYKGMTFEDKYPGHGPKDRDAKAALAAEHGQHDGLRAKVKDLVQRRRHALQAVINEPTQLASLAGSRLAALSHAQMDFSARQEAIQRDFDLLVRSYRNANTAVRGTPPPDYFARVSDLRIAPNGAFIKEVVESLTSVQKAAGLMHFQNQDALTQKLNTLQEDGARILNETVPAFVASAEKEAQDNINKDIQSIRSVGLNASHA